MGPLRDGRLVTDGGQDLAAAELEAGARGDIRDREQEMAYAGPDIVADARDAFGWGARDPPIDGNGGEAAARSRDAGAIAIDHQQHGDRACERSRVAAEFTARRVQVVGARRDLLGTPPADIDAVRHPRGQTMDAVALTADPDRD